MLKALKSYWAFAGIWYKIVVLALLPLVVILGGLVLVNIDTELIVFALVGFFIFLWVIEPMSDHWFTGGIYGKNKGALEFLQSSNRFWEFMKDVVVIDAIRRCLTYIVVYAVLCMLGILYEAEKDMEENLYLLCLFVPFLSMFVSQVEVFIGRHFEMWNHRYAVGMVGFIIESMILTGLINKVAQGMQIEVLWMISVVLFVLFIAASIGTVAYTKKKVRESYYDK